VLVTHLTDVQNTGSVYADAGRRILLERGELPHLMRAGRAEVTLSLAEGDWRVYALRPDGTRVRRVASRFSDGKLFFAADVAAVDTEATYLYEIVR
jgi:hypothetical protein